MPEELGDAGGRERAAVRRLQLDDELLLALRIAERNTFRALVLVQGTYELEPLVHRRQQLAVGGGDLLPVLADAQAVTPSSSSSASTSASISTTDPASCSATAFGVFRP